MEEEEERWWKSIDSVDPITLESICEFNFEPFRIGKTYFDAEMLSHYLISTAVFAHPTTREPITRNECIRLDEHLKQLGISRERKVVEAFDLLSSSSKVSNQNNEALRREATLLFQQLFTFRNQQRNKNHHHHRRKSRPLSSGLVVIDDDEEQDEAINQLARRTFDLEHDFPELFRSNNNNKRNDRLVRPAPRGGSINIGRIYVTQEEDDEVPSFPSTLEERFGMEEEEANRISIETEMLTEHALELKQQIKELQDETEKMIEEEQRMKEEKQQQAQAEAILRKNMQQHKNKRRPLPAQSPQEEEEEKIDLTKFETKVEEQQHHVNRKFIDPITNRGPCYLFPLIITLTFISSVLFWLSYYLVDEKSAEL